MGNPVGMFEVYLVKFTHYSGFLKYILIYVKKAKHGLIAYLYVVEKDIMKMNFILAQQH